MPVDTEALKMQPWAPDGNRVDPEDAGLVREDGWPVQYEQQGTGKHPERGVWNQLLYELTVYFTERMRHGVLPWSDQVNYRHVDGEFSAFCVGSDGWLYVSREPSGPELGNSADPEAPAGQTVWRRY